MREREREAGGSDRMKKRGSERKSERGGRGWLKPPKVFEARPGETVAPR